MTNLERLQAVVEWLDGGKFPPASMAKVDFTPPEGARLGIFVTSERIRSILAELEQFQAVTEQRDKLLEAANEKALRLRRSRR